MDSKELNNIWSDIESKNYSDSDNLILRKIDISGFHVGIDGKQKHRVIVVECRRGLIDQVLRKNPNWKGIKFMEVMLGIERFGICLSLVIPGFASIFESFAVDLAEGVKMNRNDEELIDLFILRLEKWKNFFDKYGLTKLGRDSQVGLYGELIFLKKYLLPNCPVKDVLEFWRGHDRKHQDYRFPNGNLEVKTTTAKQHIKVFISSEKQLDITGIANLFLLCIVLNDSVSNGVSLKVLVEECEELIGENLLAQRMFTDYLINAGYLKKDEAYYNEEKYTISKELVYEVKEGFPCITNVPNGIGDIRYSIMLASCENYKTEISRSLNILLETKNGEY